jgi:signal transduction histidine kinase
LFVLPRAPVAVVYLILVPLAMLIINAARSKKLRENRYNMLFLFALVMYAVWYPFNIIVMGNRFFSPGVIPNLFLMMSQSVILAVNYAETKNREAALAAENAALVRYDKMKTDLIATVSHETRTPLAVLSLYSELIAKELRGEGVKEQTAQDLDRISGEALRIAGLMDDLSGSARAIEDGSLKTQLNLSELIRSMERMYRPILARRNLTLTVDIPDGVPPVHAAAAEITQVLFNLVNNARAHMEGGEITVGVAPVSGAEWVALGGGKRAHGGGKYVMVTVTDTGTGIAPDIMPRLFERGVSGRPSGQGLGLPICKEIIESGHGGDIRIESAPGKGTTVRFTLPVRKEETKR